MQFELLLHLDVVPDLSLVVLQLRLVLFGWQVQRVERRREVRSRSILNSKATVALLVIPTRIIVFLFLKPELH